MSSLLQDNRQYALVPENNFEISIGTSKRALHTLYTSNVEAFGEINTQRLVINGYVFDVNDLFVPSVEKENELKLIQSELVATSNLIVKETVTASNFIGNGDQLNFPALKSSIIPGSASLTLGSSNSLYANVFSDALTAQNASIGDTVTAGYFEGDASRLTNLDRMFDRVNEDIIPDSNMVHYLGSHTKRFDTVYLRNVDAINDLRGKRMVITNETHDQHLDEFISEVDDFIAKFDINEDVMKRLSDKINIQADNIIAGVTYAVDSINKSITVQDRIVPQFSDQCHIGTSDLIFTDVHTNKLHVYDTLTLKDVSADAIVCNKIESEEISGNGQFIDGITHFGRIASNIIPKFDDDVSIGSPSLKFKEVQAKTMIADNIKLSGSGQVAVPVIGKLDLRVGFVYRELSRMRFEAESISSFAHSIDFDRGSFVVDKSGLYHISLFGLMTSEKNASQDLTTQWQISHFNRAMNTTNVIKFDRQLTHTIFLTELDTISLSLFSAPVAEMTVTQGIVVVNRVATIPDLSDVFSTL